MPPETFARSPKARWVLSRTFLGSRGILARGPPGRADAASAADRSGRADALAAARWELWSLLPLSFYLFFSLFVVFLLLCYGAHFECLLLLAHGLLEGPSTYRLAGRAHWNLKDSCRATLKDPKGLQTGYMLARKRDVANPKPSQESMLRGKT